MNGQQQPWARHFQSPYRADAGAPELPDYLRVAFLAWGWHRANGHAVFRQGQVAQVLSNVDTATGEIFTPSRQQVHQAIKTAIGHGWLAQGSTSLCLIVPAHRIAGGLGEATDPCPRHHLPARKRRSPASLKIVGDL